MTFREVHDFAEAAGQAVRQYYTRTNSNLTVEPCKGIATLSGGYYEAQGDRAVVARLRFKEDWIVGYLALDLDAAIRPVFWGEKNDNGRWKK